jgi:hypothetical protein
MIQAILRHVLIWLAERKNIEGTMSKKYRPGNISNRKMQKKKNVEKKKSRLQVAEVLQIVVKDLQVHGTN